MVSILLSIPLLSLVSILQTTVVSRMPLLQGTADLVMLFLIAWSLQERVQHPWQWAVVGGVLTDFFSGLPFGVFTASYVALTGLAQLLGQRLWRFTVLIQLFLTLLGTMLTHTVSALVIIIQGTRLEFLNVLRTITLPSLLLNILLTIPVYIIVQDLAGQIYPQELEI